MKNITILSDLSMGDVGAEISSNTSLTPEQVQNIIDETDFSGVTKYGKCVLIKTSSRDTGKYMLIAWK